MDARIRFACGDAAIERCHDLAVETLLANIRPFRDGLLPAPAPCILAGAAYDTPWTRDCAYNVWNAGSLVVPDAARNTLLSVLERTAHGVRIGGQYWDAIAWAIGAWHHYCVTGDREFLTLALKATSNTLDFFEQTEYDPETGLFMGPASYGDGVASYPPPYDDAGGSSGILDYPAAHPEIGKIRMKCLSTNCLYFGAYQRAALMERALGGSSRGTAWLAKANALQRAIVERLWLPGEGRFAYFLGNDNEPILCHEGLGHALALLLHVADNGRAAQVLAAQPTTPFGIPCTWPIFDKYRSADGLSCGRHNGTVWPFIQGFWADAAAQHGRLDLLEHELVALTRAVERAGNFMEIFHPFTGEPYGGLQVDRGTMRLWESCPHQTWSATGYLRILYTAMGGLDVQADGIRLRPALPACLRCLHLDGIVWRKARLSVALSGNGRRIAECRLDGQRLPQPFLPVDLSGQHAVEVVLSP